MKRFKRLLKALFGERSKREVHCVAYFEADVLRLKIRVIIKISKKSLLSYKCGLIFIGMKPFFFEIKITMADSKKQIFNSPNSQFFFFFRKSFSVKILMIILVYRKKEEVCKYICYTV